MVVGLVAIVTELGVVTTMVVTRLALPSPPNNSIRVRPAFNNGIHLENFNNMAVMLLCTRL